MIQVPSLRPGATALCVAGGSLLSLVAGVTLLAGASATAAPLAYPEAVTNTDKAARAVLARAGRESCLRGKLTNALLGLSNSCEASGTRNPLCSLADKAAVVTPMSLSFMDETSHQLLELIHPGSIGPQASAARPTPEPMAAEP